MRSSEERYEAIVVGGGPAGAAAAIELARRGHRVLVLERSPAAPEKVCGEYLCPAGVTLMRELGVLEPVLARPHRTVRRIRISSPGGHAVEGRFTGDGESDPFGLSMARADLDAVLLAEAASAGADVRAGALVVEVQRRDDGVEVDWRFHDGERGRARGELLIGADGRFSIVAKKLGLAVPVSGPARAVVHGRFANVAAPSERVDMHLFARRRYAGINYLPDGSMNVSLVTDLGDVKTDLDGWRTQRFQEQLGESALLRRQLEGAAPCAPARVLAPLGVRSAVCSERVLLAGDAAGFLDPLTGEGIYAALATGAAAGRVAAGALAARSCERRLLAYVAARNAILGAKQRLNVLFQWLLGHPRLQDRLGRRLAATRLCRDALVSVIGNTQPPSALLSPRMLCDLWRTSSRSRIPMEQS
jgi:flavin-dependent dehydrogenase